MQNEVFSNPRIIVVQKLYAKEFNKETELTFPKHKYKKFIKNDDVLLDNIDSKLSKLKHHLIGLVSVSSSEQCNKKLELIRRFSDNIRINDSSCIQYIDIFTRKLKKHDMSCILFNTKMSDDENNIRMLSTSPLKYINWIFTPLKV